MKKNVIVVSGPTASGKTDLAIELALKFGGEVVNFDSLLLYKEISIGTAKPTLEEQKEIPHHLIDVASIASPLNAADFSRLAYPLIEKLLSEKKVVYLVGGSGFYLQAILKGMYESKTTPIEITNKSDDLYKAEGITPFLRILNEVDLTSFERYHENDHYRIRRAVEHFWTTGKKFSEAREKKDEEKTVDTIHDWNLLHIYLDLPKDEHFKIIEKRSQRMVDNGLLNEVKNLLSQGFTGEEKPLQSIGYKEALDYLKGEFSSLEECIARINISTRQLAKSQRTWFNRISNKFEVHPIDQRAYAHELVNHFLQK